MKRRLGTVLAILLCIIVTAVSVYADDGKSQNPDYATDYYMIVQSAQGGADIYDEADPKGIKLNDGQIPNGTAIHVLGEKDGTDGKKWAYTQYHGMNGYIPMDDLDPASLDVPYAKRPELDRWIISKYNKLIKEVTADMDQYDHMKAVRKIQDFVIEDMSNWYIRRARRRFWAEELDEDKKSVYATTYEVMVGLSQLIAPFAPFISEEIYQNLTGKESVHLSFFPKADEALIDEKAEERMDLVRTLVGLGRGTREKERIKVRQPLKEILVDGKYESIIGDLTPLIKEELNIKDVLFESKLDAYMNYSLKPNFKVAGPVLGKNIKAFGAALAQADPAATVAALEADGKIALDLNGESMEISKDMVDVKISAKEGFAVAMENNVFTILDTTVTPELAEEGLARELVSKVQQMRKQNDYEMMDKIHIYLSADDDVAKAVEDYREYIMKETLAESIENKEGLEEVDLNGHKTGLAVERI